MVVAIQIQTGDIMRYLMRGLFLLISTLPMVSSAVYFTVTKYNEGREISILFSHRSLYLKGSPKGTLRGNIAFSLESVSIMHIDKTPLNDVLAKVTVTFFNETNYETLSFFCSPRYYDIFQVFKMDFAATYSSDSKCGKHLLYWLQKTLENDRLYFDIPPVSWYEWFQNRKKYILGMLLGIGTGLGFYAYYKHAQKRYG
jgi:hypothetical protein